MRRRKIQTVKYTNYVKQFLYNKWTHGLLTVVLVLSVLLICQEVLKIGYTMTTADAIALGQGSALEAQVKYNADRARRSAGYRSLPQCIIIGVRKAGTKAFKEFLDMHPKIATAKHEPHFFDNESRYAQGIPFYLDLMPNSKPDQIVIEKTPRYFLTPHVPNRIRLMNETIKLILVVREPVRRMISEYVQFDLLKGNNVSFESLAVLPNGDINENYSCLKNSKYYINFKRWLQYFPREQIHLVDGNRLITHPFKEIIKAEKFLGLEHKITEDLFYFDKQKGYFCRRKIKNERTASCLGESKGRPHPFVDPSVCQQLREYFKPYNELFFDLAKRDFDW